MYKYHLKQNTSTWPTWIEKLLLCICCVCNVHVYACAILFHSFKSNSSLSVPSVFICAFGMPFIFKINASTRTCSFSDGRIHSVTAFINIAIKYIFIYSKIWTGDETVQTQIYPRKFLLRSNSFDVSTDSFGIFLFFRSFFFCATAQRLILDSFSVPSVLYANRECKTVNSLCKCNFHFNFACEANIHSSIQIYHRHVAK